ncbi:MAG: PAS domain S-box protein [Planctomycetes bacterium]|nr:PAS domain S-box protein [Planctomycetota bacterium]
MLNSLKNRLVAYLKKNLFRSIRGKLVGCIVLMTMFPLVIVSIIAYCNGKNALELRVVEQMTSIADLKKVELNNWLKERLVDTVQLSNDNSLQAGFTSLLYIRRASDTIENMLKSEMGETYYNKLLSYLQELKREYKCYDEIAIMDAVNGEIIVSTTETNMGRIDEDFESYTSALTKKGASIKDIYYSDHLGQVGMTFFGAIHKVNPVTMELSNKIIGVVLLRLSMRNSIEPLIQNWPGMGETGETFLVRKEGKSILFLNKLRHDKDAALRLTIPQSSPIAEPAIMCLSGHEGITKTVDYRNIRVLCAYRHIPMMEWGLFAKQDVKEAFAPIEKLKKRMLILVMLSAIGVITAVFLVARSITRPVLKLVKGANAIGAGDLSQKIMVLSQDEIGMLASEFNQMAVKLREFYTILEQKINQRTAQLQASEEKYRELINFANDAIFTLDMGTAQIIDANKKAIELTGHSKDDLLRMKIWEIHPQHEANKAKQLWKKVIEEGSGVLDEIEQKRKDGKIVPVSISASIIKYGDKRVVQKIYRDITERKMFQEQLIRAERLAVVGELAAIVAHEVNNPLAGLQNFVKLIESEPHNIQQTREFMHLMAEGLKRIEFIVRGLLAFSKPHFLNFAEHDIREIIESSLKFVDHRLEVEHISLRKQFHDDLLPVYVDANSITQVVVNILINALDSMTDGGALSIVAANCDRFSPCIKVMISDTGTGIKQEIMDKIFDPFFTTKGNGVGLGLAISKRIIEAHGGEIEVQSPPKAGGKGTTFSLHFPAHMT